MFGLLETLQAQDKAAGPRVNIAFNQYDRGFAKVIVLVFVGCKLRQQFRVRILIGLNCLGCVRIMGSMMGPKEGGATY